MRNRAGQGPQGGCGGIVRTEKAPEKEGKKETYPDVHSRR